MAINQHRCSIRFLVKKASGCEAEDAFSATVSATTGAGTTICVGAWRVVFLVVFGTTAFFFYHLK